MATRGHGYMQSLNHNHFLNFHVLLAALAVVSATATATTTATTMATTTTTATATHLKIQLREGGDIIHAFKVGLEILVLLS